MRELNALQKQQNRKNFACQGAGKLTGLGVLLHDSQCCSASLAHARPAVFYIPPSIPTNFLVFIVQGRRRGNQGRLQWYTVMHRGIGRWVGG